MPQLILILPLIACYMDIAKPFKHVPPKPVCVIDFQDEATIYEVPTIGQIAEVR
jgi:hypothetical protein